MVMISSVMEGRVGGNDGQTLLSHAVAWTLRSDAMFGDSRLITILTGKRCKIHVLQANTALLPLFQTLRVDARLVYRPT